MEPQHLANILNDLLSLISAANFSFSLYDLPPFYIVFVRRRLTLCPPTDGFTRVNLYASSPPWLSLLRFSSSKLLSSILRNMPILMQRPVCFQSHYLISSDVDEYYLGEHILDALADVSPSITEHNSDFELYRRLLKGGRSSLHLSELAGPPDEVSEHVREVEEFKINGSYSRRSTEHCR